MCKLFTGADPALWESQTRSMRLDGVSTSVRLEGFFWGVLEEIGRRDDLGLSQLLTRLSREWIESGRDVDNFASFLRVCCGRYYALQLAGEVPTRHDAPIADLDAEAILAREHRRRHAATGARQAEAASCPATR
ncbi:ribbon-helix-helix domain-containing protein [Halomonas maura]|uniref:ribbon-helix-helix domain-containing protein n=1 Tax=Halomonas maura TaxID=117606 RepID=UPI0025B52784|nr:ribbon-helix-helix domain-containing protein [Halomonas maura]MDN3555090.1 ribbon-helix-helix domain-containing protein [Halomonas maura]